MDSSAVWNSLDPTLSVAPHDDFQQFLDMGINNLGDNLQFDFPDFDHQPGQDSQMMHQDGGDQMDGGRGTIAHDTTMQEHMPAMTTSASHPANPGPASNGQLSSGSIGDLDAQIQFLQQQRHEQQQRQMQEQQQKYFAPNGMIPPTPNSMELHGASSQFYPQSDPQHQAMYERFRMQTKDQDMAFTPLVSPAVTPLESHFSVPEYTVPGAYFSPLSSPALHAQNERSSVYDQRRLGATDSPGDTSLNSHSAPASSVVLSRKSSKKALQKPRSTRGVRQSPITKPRKGKKGSSTSIPTQALGDILEPADHHHARAHADSLSRSTVSTEESENGSISPEHLSHMAPPPVPTPGSAGRSPYVLPQKTARVERLALGSPATPASLMRLTQSPATSQPVTTQDMDVDDQGMEDFSLPEAANDTRPLTSGGEVHSDNQVTPTMSSSGAKTQAFPPLPSPASARSGPATSASQSPQIDPLNGATVSSRRTPQIAPRGPKKRFSNSVHASPALLPRISPSIKPLLPGGGTTADDTASLLLASKSNYQNILEGTHLPGVSYPTDLSTNLTSKRTSHKIAEQGRRNRINSALQEIATLLPRAPGKDGSGGEKSGSGGDAPETAAAKVSAAAQSANSKASTVELAIDYIKQLKTDLAEAIKRADDAEKRLSTTRAEG